MRTIIEEIVSENVLCESALDKLQELARQADITLSTDIRIVINDFQRRIKKGKLADECV
ncbi:MAG: hypothetical protein QXS20_00930 [Candidatus Thorarchaeota archaeon]